jgi:hypothetical protein
MRLQPFAQNLNLQLIRRGPEMVKQAKRSPRRLRREALVFAHLEHASKELLLRHPDIVRELIGRNAGVYALYRKNSLYYVGLASALRHRLTAHGRNRHGKNWDHFSIYLTIKDQHLREIEALLLRISKPPGARQSGKLAQSKDMKRQILRAIRTKLTRQTTSLFGDFINTDAMLNSASKGETDLIRLFPSGARLKGTNKGRVFRASVKRDGRVRFGGKFYTSVSEAAKAAIKRPTNGWWFWQVERGKGNWVRLKEIRKVGTPLYAR